MTAPGGATSGLGYLLFAVVVVSAVAAVLILNRAADSEQKRSRLRVLAVAALSTVAVIGAVVSVGICLGTVCDFFS
ncbi:hypothetical protein [Corynebacterium variabile]|uniref:hypothetical protein n=1 Tax=Corynebacterium variabile TaxID=1727 RepID=UPI003FD4FAAF